MDGDYYTVSNLMLIVKDVWTQQLQQQQIKIRVNTILMLVVKDVWTQQLQQQQIKIRVYTILTTEIILKTVTIHHDNNFDHV